MTYKEWNFLDKKNWGDGPWQSEPDKVQWKHLATGLVCMMRRNPVYGNWCGYVGVPSTHPYHGMSTFDLTDIETHGGLNYSAACSGDPEYDICHVPEPGEPDDVWWFGFDCGHAYDIQPGLKAAFAKMEMLATCLQFPGEVYRDFAYVKDEVESLASQLNSRKEASG